MPVTPGRIPVNVLFSPSWWHRHYGVSFLEDFYLHPERRIANDILMRNALWERFGIGEPAAAPRPVAGSMHIAGGFVMPALFGNRIRFAPDQAAWPVVRELSRDEILALVPPDLGSVWPMSVLLPQFEQLKARFGFVAGDLNTGGLLNNAMELRGNQFFLDLLEDPELCDHLLGVIARTQIAVAQRVKSYTGSCAIATNLSVLCCDPSLYLASNCSVQMISPALYAKRILPFDRLIAEAMRPNGFHHCGNNLHLFAPHYATLHPKFVDVGWGSDIARCAALLPDAFLNLRLSPVRLLQESAQTVYGDALAALRAAARTERVGVCCINMDSGTPDSNVEAIFEAAAGYSREAAV